MNGPLATADKMNRMATDAHPTPDADASPQTGNAIAALLPWGVSLAIHTALVVLALGVIWAVVAEPQTEAGVKVAHATPAQNLHQLVFYDTPEALSSASQADADHSAMPYDVIRLSTAEAKRVADELAVRLPPEARDAEMDDARANDDAAAAADITPTALAEPVPDLTGPFGIALPRLGEDRPRRVVYLVDASGSLVDTFPVLLDEVKRSIAQLPAGDLFTVIFFREGQVIEPRPLGLKEASPITRLEVIRWIDQVYASGRTDAVPAIERALSYRPDDIFLLSDHIAGRGLGTAHRERDQHHILDVIAQTSRGSRIHTVQLLYQDPLAHLPGHEGTLATIARQTDGVHVFLRDNDLFPRSE